MSALLDCYGYEAVIAASVSDALKSARSGGRPPCQQPVARDRPKGRVFPRDCVC